VHFLRHVVVLAGAGVGGGSLNYANTLYEPMEASFYDDPQWAALADWRSELAPYYDQAKRMLGATQNPTMTPSDEAMLEVAGEMGVADSFHLAPVGVAFGPPGTPAGAALGDPYFAGAGPSRRSCLECGECMTGCRHGAKNTLPTNYLHLAERAGAVIMPLTTARSVQPGAAGGWEVGTLATGWSGAWRRRLLRCEHVVLAAGAVGTQQLLHAMAMEDKLPDLSPRLGQLTRTNSESLLGAVVGRGRPRPDFSRGVAITSSFSPEPGTHVEPVRYGRGSNLMGLFGTLLVDGPEGPSARPPGWRRFLRAVAGQPVAFLRQFDLRGWSERTVIALVMQSRDNSLAVSSRRRFLGGYRLTTSPGHGRPHPTWLPVGHDVARRLANRTGGRPSGTWGEIFGVPMTAHFLGGCAIGASAAAGVIDQWHRVFGYEGLHVVDGSAVPANPGVNPSLTITAMAERAFAYWPNRGQPDPRPVPAPGPRPVPAPGPSGATPTAPPPTSARPHPVFPDRPVVPAGAAGELRPAGTGRRTGLEPPGTASTKCG
jgi:cholesterol oxidase